MKRHHVLLVSWSLFLSSYAGFTICSAQNPAETVLAPKAQDAESLFQRARAHLAGEAQNDPQQAFDLMQQAAAQGHPGAIGGMGYFYANGVVVEKDEAKAVEWFRQGAEKGSVKAQYNLGMMLLGGKGIAKDVEKGRECLKHAADQGLSEAIFTLGRISYLGEHGEKRNLQRAFPLLSQAAEQGHLEALSMVGLMLSDGQGVKRNLPEGIKLLRQAAQRGSVTAQSSLGRVLQPSNRRTDKDPAERIEALMWLTLAAGQGDILAPRILNITLPISDKDEIAAARKKAAEFKVETDTATLENGSPHVSARSPGNAAKESAPQNE